MGSRSIYVLAVQGLIGLLLAAAPALAQEHHATHGHQGRHGVGQTLARALLFQADAQGHQDELLHLSDCAPTQSRMIDDHYEVLVDGEWTKVLRPVIQNVTAP